MKIGFIAPILGGGLLTILCTISIVLVIKYRKEENINDVKIKVNGGKELAGRHSNANDLIMDFVGIEDEVEHTVCFLYESSNKKTKGNLSASCDNIAGEENASKICTDVFLEKRIRLTDINSNRIFEAKISDEIIIGRLNQEGKTNFIEIDYDKSISRVHCKIERKQNGYYLSDLGSANHVFLNNSILKGTVEMFSGQVFTLGNVKLMFEVL